MAVLHLLQGMRWVLLLIARVTVPSMWTVQPQPQLPAQSNIESIHWMFRQVGAGMLLVVVAAGESENIGSVSICCLPAVFTTTTTATITYLSIHNQLTPKNAAEETKTFPSPRLKYSWCAVRHCSTDWQWCNSIITYLHVTWWKGRESQSSQF